MSDRSYLIVGAGVFGVSTAYYLIKKYPNASITIVDKEAFDAETRVAASWDWNKVVRADYDDFMYCRLALESQDIFRNDPLWKPYYHEAGVFWICRSEYAQDVINNYKRLGRTADIQAIPIEEAKKLYGGLFKDADYEGATEVLVNRTSGWAAAGDALRAVTRQCLDLGVKYVVADVATLDFDTKGHCCGVKTTRGDTIKATHTLLCTGAYTAKLLELSAAASGNPDLSSGDRITAAGITTGMRNLDEESYPKFANMPVGFQGYPPEIGPFLGSIPPTPDRDIKWWGWTIFKNTRELLPGRFVSAPPDTPDYSQWKVGKKLQNDVRRAAKSFYGQEAENWKYSKHRICWDAFTTSGDFIISPHSGTKGLFLATCGSFHGFKFFPVLGKYVTQMLEGTLEPELMQKWSWDRQRPSPDTNSEWPRAELNDMLDNVARL